MSARIEFCWTDPALAVMEDLAETFTDGNVSHMIRAVTIPSDKVWLPTLVVVEGVSTVEILREVNNVELDKNGNIMIVFPYVLSFSCRFDISNYPFDEHDCLVTVVDSSFSVNVLPSGDPWNDAIAQTFGVEGEWDLTGVREKMLVYRSGQSFTQCVVHLRRKTTFFVVLTIAPLVVTSYLNVLVFLLPPDLGDKASYLVTVMVSMSVFVSFFNTDMPRGVDKMPAIFHLLIFVSMENFLTLGISLFMLRRYKAERCQQDITNASVMTSAISSELNTATPNVSYSSGELAVPTGKGDLSYTGKHTSASDSAISKGQLPLSSSTGYSWEKMYRSAGSLDLFLFVVAFIANTLGVGIILASMV
ncbi:acetylcholine receptor subunit beta-type acr-3-like [Littorina saxatilis]|uniref:acetylcholine receptor subunit beta-type acr-3-like n=1 Tax=Littorina saxatilis TaxID=31220 RepID=UPI0038B51380